MQTPLVLVVGYLGAGKTTFLQQVIPALASAGLRPRVILNDYQDARVDAARLAALDTLVTPISGDCICCGSREELITTLVGMERLPGDVVVIEANGTSDAAELHDILLLDRRVAGFARPQQVTVIDVRRWQKRWFDKTLERDQAEVASHLWLNWTEGLPDWRLDEVRTALRALNPAAVHTTPAGVAAEVTALVAALADAPVRAEQGEARPTSPGHHERHHFASLGVTMPPLVRRAALEALVQRIAPSLRRAKGVVTLAESPDRQHTWSYLGGDRRLRFDVLPQSGFAPVAVFIGAGLPEDEIRAAVAALQEAPPT